MKILASLLIIATVFATVSTITFSIVRLAMTDDYAYWHIRTVLSKTQDRR